MKKIKFIFPAAIAGFVAISAVLYSRSSDGSKVMESYSTTSEFVFSHEESKSEISLEPLCVYVCGAVNNPGVIYLDEGSRICDAIKKAGGITADADINSLNQAEKVTDGQKIYVPLIGETDAGYSENSKSSLININTAGVNELLTLPGIGESKANAIIAYHNDNGGFKKIEDIMNISGIKEAAFNKIKENICV